MFRYAKWLPCAAALATGVLLGTASSARAGIDLMLTVADNSGDSATATYDFTDSKFLVGPTFTGTASGFFVPVGGPGGAALMFEEILPGQTIGGYTVMVSTGVTNAPGRPALAFVRSTNNTITGSGSGLTITSSADGFTTPSSPPAPALLLDTNSTAGTSLNNTVTSVSYSGYAGTVLGDSSLASASGTYSTPAGAGSGSGPDRYSTFSNNGMPYALTEILSIGSGDAEFGSLSGQVDVSPLPEPATMMAALTAVPFLGLGAWLRRRKQAG